MFTWYLTVILLFPLRSAYMNPALIVRQKRARFAAEPVWRQSSTHTATEWSLNTRPPAHTHRETPQIQSSLFSPSKPTGVLKKQSEAIEESNALDGDPVVVLWSDAVRIDGSVTLHRRRRADLKASADVSEMHCGYCEAPISCDTGRVLSWFSDGQFGKCVRLRAAGGGDWHG